MSESHVDAGVQSTRTFDNVRALIPHDGTLDRGVLPKWNYVLKKSKIIEYRKKLKEIQQMFLFMKHMMLEAQPAKHRSPSTTARDPSVAGPSQHLPITLSGQGTDENGRPVTYHATLVMKPRSQSETRGPTFDYIKSRSREEKEKKTKEESQETASQLLRPPSYLSTLRQNPYFSPELLLVGETRSGIASRGERLLGSIRDDRKRRQSRRSSRGEIEQEGSNADLEIPDDNEAARDVDDLMESVGIRAVPTQQPPANANNAVVWCRGRHSRICETTKPHRPCRFVASESVRQKLTCEVSLTTTLTVS